MSEQENNQEQQAQSDVSLDETTQRVLNVIAMHMGSFHYNQRTGILTFQIQFNEGVIPANGYRQIVDETVV